MAISVTQEPKDLQQANSDLLYVVSSTQTNQPQFQYIANIQLIYGAGAEIKTFQLKQQPNPDGYGVFNLSQLVSSQHRTPAPNEADPKFSTGENFYTFVGASFVEEYGTSPSSSVATGSSVNAGSIYTLGGVNERNSGAWDFDAEFCYTGSSRILNQMSACEMTTNDYGSISWWQGSLADYGTTAVAYVDFSLRDVDNNEITSSILYNTIENGGGPWRDATIGQPFASQSFNSNFSVISMATGVQDVSTWFPAITGSDVVANRMIGYNDLGQPIWAFRCNFTDGDCGYDTVRFAWLNENGVMDYHTFTLAETKSDNITRETYEQTFVPYNTSTSTITYDKSRRGSKVYSISYDETRAVESDWLGQGTADHLRTLVESPEVYIQDGDDFLPVIITNSTFQYKVNPRSQKMYNLRVEYKLANNRRSR